MDNYVLFLTPLFRYHSPSFIIIHIIIPDQHTALAAAANHINLKTLVY